MYFSTCLLGSYSVAVWLDFWVQWNEVDLYHSFSGLPSQPKTLRLVFGPANGTEKKWKMVVYY